MTDPLPRGLDPRRQFSDADRRRLHANQRARCAICQQPVRLRDGSFHVHHVIPHHLGGATVLRNAVGLCDRCHRELDHSTLTGPPDPELREWQALYVNAAVTALSADGGIYTVAAAPGAGKSLFTGVVADRLWEAGQIGRVVVVAPTGQLIEQWADNLAYDARIWIDPTVRTAPWNQALGYLGAAVTYASFAKASAVIDHIELANQVPTLFIFDEVHHAADRRSWGEATRALVAQVPTARFLNLSGTLFRSNPGERIAVVDYHLDDDGMLAANADAVVWATDLISKRDLRPLELFEFDTEVHSVDVTTGEIAHSTIGIAGDDTTVHSALISDNKWLSDFFDRWLAHVGTQRAAFSHNFKGLVVAANQELAELYKLLLQDKLSGTGQPVWVAKSEDGDLVARQALEDARTSIKPGVLVAVAMASEGYDNPDLSSIAYLSNVAAPLRLAQVGGRVMRPTELEKVLGRNLPGTVWLPAIPKLIAVWRDVLLNELHTISVDDLTCARCGLSKPCACTAPSRICALCGLPKPCQCETDGLGHRRDPEVEHRFGDSDLTGVWHNGEAVTVDAFHLITDALIAAGKYHLVPHAAEFVQTLEPVDLQHLARTIHKENS